MTHAITVRAADGRRGVTLGELAELVEQAIRAEISLSAHIDVDVGWRGQVTTVTVMGDERS